MYISDLWYAVMQNNATVSFFCMPDIQFHSVTHMCWLRNTPGDTIAALRMSGLTHQSESQLSSLFLSRCPSLFYAVLHTLSLFVFSSYSPPIFLVSATFSHLSECEAEFDILLVCCLLTSLSSQLCKCHTHTSVNKVCPVVRLEKFPFTDFKTQTVNIYQAAVIHLEDMDL